MRVERYDYDVEVTLPSELVRVVQLTFLEALDIAAKAKSVGYPAKIERRRPPVERSEET